MDALLTPEDMCKILAIKPRALQVRIARGTVPAPVKVGRLNRWRKVDVERWLGVRP